MSLEHSLVTLNQSPQMITFDMEQEIPYAAMLTISIQNLHPSAYVFLGDKTLSTASYGFRLMPDQTFTAVFSPQDELYAIADSGEANIGIIRIQH